jgi:hypothetical protein
MWEKCSKMAEIDAQIFLANSSFFLTDRIAKQVTSSENHSVIL